MTRHYIWTITMEVPDEGPPRLTDIAVRSAARHEPGTPEVEAAPLTETARDFLLERARQKGVLDQYALRIRGAQTHAEGKALSEELRALPDPRPTPAQLQGA